MELFIPTLNSENQRCREHSQYYLRELKNFRLWATEMFDATAKFPSGVLHGSIYSLGNFDQCIEVRVPYREEFTGKYCLAKFTVKPPDYLGLNHDIDYVRDNYEEYFNISTWEKITVFSQDVSKGSRNDLYLSFCLPSSCTNKDLENSLERLIINYDSIIDFEVTVDVDERSCQVVEKLRFTTADIVFIAIITIFVVIVIFASVYHLATEMDNMDHYKVSRKFHKIIMCFSFPHNMKKLASKSTNEDGLDCISGLKTLSMCFIIMGHRCMFTFGSPMTNPKFIEEMYTRVEATVFLNGPIIVDTFFVISGFLATYLIIHFFEKHKFNANILMIYLHRIIRMLPAYVIVLAFYCTLFVKIGSGPFWQERVGLEQERCLQSWWTNLLHINNYAMVDKLCMFQSWYLTCDMHYFLCVPLLVWLLRKKPTAGILTVASLIISSIFAVFVTVYVNNEDGILLLYIKLLKDPVLNKTFRNIYIPSHLRASPYLLGIITAYIKYQMKITNYKMPKHVLYVGWMMCVVVVSITVYTAFVFYIPGYPHDTIFSAFYASLHHFTFSLCMSWIIIAVSSGNGAWIEPILSWKPLIFLSRITYTAFLSHGAVQITTSAIMRVPRYVGVFNILYDTCGDIVVSYVIGFILTMYFEAPIIGLEKIIFKREDKTYISKAVAKSKISETVVISVPKIKAIS
ncbi:nose resistant to fluoxetine protein 6-like [Anoplophora glabripennis]|uniref:nose resistant to fluoxetine protein 6-like n=1 Tax=Anoplophora glabripennis TaxID=217634 RepID=UPI000C7819B7|nr:nose resistant to fluoxetine protein 6-like [Anoplophora glabripennis]